MTRGRPWPRTSSADYKSSRSIQFQLVRGAEKSRKYSHTGISYQLGTGFHAAASAAAVVVATTLMVVGFFPSLLPLSFSLSCVPQNPVSLIYTVSRLNGYSQIKPSERWDRGFVGTRGRLLNRAQWRIRHPPRIQFWTKYRNDGNEVSVL